MKITMVAVSSVNGKITKASDPNIYKWTSDEDKKLFFSMIEKNNLIVMGRKTYEAVRHIIKLKKNKLRIVLTRNTRRYKDDLVKEQLEFSSESPKELVKRLESQGYKEMLLVGGAEVNTVFLKNHLIDELHLTIEPLIFGKGKNLLLEEEFDAKLKLVSVKKINRKGTLHLIYCLML